MEGIPINKNGRFRYLPETDHRPGIPSPMLSIYNNTHARNKYFFSHRNIEEHGNDAMV